MIYFHFRQQLTSLHKVKYQVERIIWLKHLNQLHDVGMFQAPHDLNFFD